MVEMSVGSIRQRTADSWHDCGRLELDSLHFLISLVSGEHTFSSEGCRLFAVIHYTYLKCSAGVLVSFNEQERGCRKNLTSVVGVLDALTQAKNILWHCARLRAASSITLLQQWPRCHDAVVQ
jgi:hypothetical protein